MQCLAKKTKAHAASTISGSVSVLHDDDDDNFLQTFQGRFKDAQRSYEEDSTIQTDAEKNRKAKRIIKRPRFTDVGMRLHACWRRLCQCW